MLLAAAAAATSCPAWSCGALHVVPSVVAGSSLQLASVPSPLRSQLTHIPLPILLLLLLRPLPSYVIAIALAPLVQSLVENQMQYQLNVIGLKMRNGLMAAIYRKCLRLSNAALQSESTGRIVTLMSNDAQKVCVAAANIQLLHQHSQQCMLLVLQHHPAL